MTMHKPLILIQQQLTFAISVSYIYLAKLFQSKLDHKIPPLNASACISPLKRIFPYIPQYYYYT